MVRSGSTRKNSGKILGIFIHPLQPWNIFKIGTYLSELPDRSVSRGKVVLGHREFCEGDPDHEHNGYDNAPAVVGVEIGVRRCFFLRESEYIVSQV